MAELLTQADYAKRRGVSRQYVHKLVRAGRIVLQGGLVDAEAADRVLADSADPARQHLSKLAEVPESGAAEASPAGGGEAPAATAGSVFQAARTSREAYQAKLAEIEYRERIGQLVARAEVEDAFFELGQRLQRLLEGRQQVLAAKLAALASVEDCRAALEQSDRETCDRIAADFRSLLAPDGGVNAAAA